jgi:hypothetical protein
MTPPHLHAWARPLSDRRGVKLYPQSLRRPLDDSRAQPAAPSQRRQGPATARHTNGSRSPESSSHPRPPRPSRQLPHTRHGLPPRRCHTSAPSKSRLRDRAFASRVRPPPRRAPAIDYCLCRASHDPLPTIWFEARLGGHVLTVRRRPLSHRGRNEDAIRNYSRALALEPKDLSARKGRARARSFLFDLDLALTDFDRGETLGRPHVRARRVRAKARSRNRADYFETIIQRSQRNQHTNVEARTGAPGRRVQETGGERASRPQLGLPFWSIRTAHPCGLATFARRLASHAVDSGKGAADERSHSGTQYSLGGTLRSYRGDCCRGGVWSERVHDTGALWRRPMPGRNSSRLR